MNFTTKGLGKLVNFTRKGPWEVSEHSDEGLWEVSELHDEGPSLETSKFYLYFSGSCIPLNPKKISMNNIQILIRFSIVYKYQSST